MESTDISREVRGSPHPPHPQGKALLSSQVVCGPLPSALGAVLW